MSVRNVSRIATFRGREPVMSRRNGLRSDPYVRPYTQFERGGVYRFGSTDLIFRPFRVA